MASHVRLLLKLPPAIRQQIFFPEPLSSSCMISRHGFTIGTTSRPLSISAHLSKQAGKNKTVYKNARPQIPIPQARDLPNPQKATPSTTSNARSPTQLPARMPPARAATPAPRPTFSDWLSTRFPRQDQILLYVSPNHTAFYLSSYGVGLFLLIGVYSYSQMFLKTPPEESGRPKLPWFTKVLGAISVLATATFGTVFILAPMKLVKSITAVRQEVQASGRLVSSHHNVMPWKLRIEVKRALPFAKADVMELKDSKQVVLDRSVPMMSQDIGFTSYGVKDSEWFTEQYATAGTLERKEGSAMKRFNRRLINIWPGVKREVKRMFLRDQMAYVRIEGNGNFKLDLQNSHMLDGGRVLDKMVGTDGDAAPGQGLRGFLVNVLGSRK